MATAVTATTATTAKFWSGLTLVATLVALAPSASWAQLTTPPDRDNTLYETVSQVEGCSASTSNGAGQYIFSGFTNNGAERRAVLRFDLSSIPPGSTITGASLTLHLNRVAGGSLPTDQFGLRRLTADWGEGTSDGGSEEGNGGPATPGDATWCDRLFQATPWTSLGGDFTSPASATIAVGTATPALHVWGPTAAMMADVQGWVDSPATNFGWILIQDLAPPRPDGGTEGVTESARRFDSREGGASIQPSLSVSFVPLGPPVVEVPTLSPWGLALLGGLLLVVALRGLRTKTSTW